MPGGYYSTRCFGDRPRGQRVGRPRRDRKVNRAAKSARRRNR